MKLSTIIPTSAAIGLVLTAGLAFAQGMNDQPPSQGSEQKPQQGGGMGGMNMGGGKQGGMGMMGMGQQGGMGMGGCGMMGMGGMGNRQQGGSMENMAALQERVNQLEQRLNAGQAQPSAPAKPQ